MKNTIVYILVFLFIANGAIAQKGTFTDNADNDPTAKALLDKLKAKYDKYLAMEIAVILTIEIPDSDAEVIEGKMVQSGEKYRIEMGEHIIISDGKDLWTVMKQNEVVQLSNAAEKDEDEESIMMSPKDLMNIYDSGDYIYALTNEAKEDGRVIQQIEFKPIDEDSEYFKMRLTVDKEKQAIARIKIFSKDGSRYTLAINKMRTNKIYDSTYFQYDKSICPECEIEDVKM
ncbi:MAG: outer membrane lipoprotein-sorting protein [Maribacter sp.]|jgi:outer membrane lipoprotein-sorting protein